MRDWQVEVGDRMGGLKLCAEARADVFRELSCPFDEIYDEARQRGAGEREAREQALGSVRDWKRFASEVQREKETLMTMTPFRRKVVAPGLVGFVFCVIPLWITSMLHHSGAQYVFRPVDPQHYFTFNIPWLLALPIAGAVGAWMSRRHGGSRRQRLAAGLFPALTFAWVPLWGSVVALVWLTLNAIAPARVTDHAGVAEWTMRVASFLVPWVMAPAISMAIGALPFVWLKPQVEEEHRADAAHA